MTDDLDDAAWLLLVRAIAAEEARLIHRPDGEPLHGDAFRVAALRAVLEHPSAPFVTAAYHRRLIRAHQVVTETQQHLHDQAMAEQADRHRREIRDAAKVLADQLRRIRHNATGKLRQEGIDWCLRQLDPPRKEE